MQRTICGRCATCVRQESTGGSLHLTHLHRPASCVWQVRTAALDRHRASSVEQGHTVVQDRLLASCVQQGRIAALRAPPHLLHANRAHQGHTAVQDRRRASSAWQGHTVVRDRLHVSSVQQVRTRMQVVPWHASGVQLARSVQVLRQPAAPLAQLALLERAAPLLPPPATGVQQAQRHSNLDRPGATCVSISQPARMGHVSLAGQAEAALSVQLAATHLGPGVKHAHSPQVHLSSL